MGWNEARSVRVDCPWNLLPTPGRILTGLRVLMGKRPQPFDGTAGLSGVDHHEPVAREMFEEWLDGSVAPGEGFWIVAGDRPAFGTQPAQIPASGMDSWDQLDGPVDWRFSVEAGEIEYMWPGRSGWVGLGVDNEAKAPLGPIVHCAHHCDRESEGGCGKTTTAIQLAAEFAKSGQRVLLVDLDAQSHCAAGLRIPDSRVTWIGTAAWFGHAPGDPVG